MNAGLTARAPLESLVSNGAGSQLGVFELNPTYAAFPDRFINWTLKSPSWLS